MKLFTKNNCCVLVFLLFSSGLLHGQERFNKRYYLEDFGVIFSSVTEDDMGYMCTGILGGPVQGARRAIFVRISATGEMEFYKAYGGDQIELGNFYISISVSGLAFRNDSVLFQSAASNVGGGNRRGMIIEFNQQGDTLKTIRYDQTNENEPTTIFPWSSIFHDGHYFTLNYIYQEETLGDLQLEKRTAEGDLVWRNVYANPQEEDLAFVLVPLEDVGVRFFLHILTDYDQPGHFQMHSVSNSGVLTDTLSFFTEEWSGVLLEAVEKDEAYYFNSLTIDPETLNRQPELLKISNEGEYLWQIPVWENNYGSHWIISLLETDDGNLVMSGTSIKLIDYPEEENAVNHVAWLAKMTPDGERLWYREYQFLDIPRAENRLRDSNTTSDGGFILCGESNDEWASMGFTESPYQRGWVLKVDEHGCLVEGCELSDNITKDQISLNYFKAGPVPATDFFNIYQGEEVADGIFEIRSLDGKLVKSFNASGSQTTYMLETNNYPQGLYILSLRTKNEILQTQKFEIIH